MRRLDDVITTLRLSLEDGSLPAGTRLEAERNLARTLDTSRSTLRAALDVLEAEGRIWRHVGKGTFAGPRAIRDERDLAAVGSRTGPAEVMETRRLVEPSLAALAAVRASTDEIAYLQTCLERLQRAGDHDAYGRWDSTLHRAIARSARNALLLAVFDAINTVREQLAWTQLWSASVLPARRADSEAQHAAIVDAIARRDASGARDAMHEHLSSVEYWLLGSSSASAADRSVAPLRRARRRAR